MFYYQFLNNKNHLLKKLFIMKLKSELYKKEQEEITDKIINILELNIILILIVLV